MRYVQEEIERVLNFKHSGLTFEAAKGAMYAPEELYAAGVSAYHALRRRCAESSINDPQLRCILFCACCSCVELWL